MKLKKPHLLNGQDSLWYDITLWFAGLKADEAVHRLLQRLGTRHHADRTWLAPNNRSQTKVRITHEWCARGVPSSLAQGRTLSTETYRWVQRSLHRHKEIYIPTPDKIPRRYRDLRVRFQLQGTCSFYCVPILDSDGKLIAALGHHKLHHEYYWPRGDRKEMRQAAAIIGAWMRTRLNKKDAPFPDLPKEPEPAVLIKQGSVSTAYPVSQIVRLRVTHGYSTVELSNGRTLTKCRSLDRWQEILPARHFMRVHRSCIINLKKITSLDRNGGHWLLTLSDQDTIHVGRQYRRELLHRLRNRVMLKAQQAKRKVP
ncbi:MAG: LytTR family DNA-binding domain-containing protein [Verrucomicrobiales bacterium]|nr:LytTR family DNA-binding domain-containing protein [Verrucomicrobiales bacterium]